MRVLLVMGLAVVLGGCAYGEAERELTRQARRGVGLVAAAQKEVARVGEQVQALQRARLDEAFDRDVREREALDAEWVIEHRRAYGVGMEGLAKQKEASEKARQAVMGNLKATEAALARLEAMQAARARWVEGFEGLEEVKP